MIPTIDPRVKYVGASHLRKLNSNQLRQLEGVMVVRDNSEPLAVIVPYETYLKLQQAALSDSGRKLGVDLINRATGARELTLELDGERQ